MKIDVISVHTAIANFAKCQVLCTIRPKKIILHAILCVIWNFATLVVQVDFLVRH